MKVHFLLVWKIGSLFLGFTDVNQFYSLGNSVFFPMLGIRTIKVCFQSAAALLRQHRS
jgi:hypothetical protein